VVTVPINAGGAVSARKTVGVGGSFGVTLGASVETSEHFCLVGACVSGSQTFSAETTFEQSFSTGTTVEGTVGGVDAAHANEVYDFDLFGYYQTMQDGPGSQTFLVIQYMVQ